jgi:HTH-type transcriptional regulator/antitoxin HigA
MATLKYTVIKSKRQYFEYCSLLERITSTEKHSKAVQDEIDLLTLLIETWDEEHTIFNKNITPVELLQSLMDDHKLKAKDLAELLGVSKGLISDILSYKKGFSKQTIRLLADHFKVSQEAFNKPYTLKNAKEMAHA